MRFTSLKYLFSDVERHATSTILYYARLYAPLSSTCQLTDVIFGKKLVTYEIQLLFSYYNATIANYTGGLHHSIYL